MPNQRARTIRADSLLGAVGLWLLAACLSVRPAIALAADGKPSPQPLRLLILVGGHKYNEAEFERFWSGYPTLQRRTWPGSPYSAFDDITAFDHDVIVMYNLSSGMTERQKENFLRLLDRGVGLVVWHHALANCQDWPEFEKIAGGRFWLQPGRQGDKTVPKSGTAHGTVKVVIADRNHPITAGVDDFEIVDEPYNRQTFADGIHVLATTDYPQSDKPLAWCHAYRKARVFSIQCGHDQRVWTNPNFRRLMGQGIAWSAGKPAAGIP